jgi:hypothetical protein
MVQIDARKILWWALAASAVMIGLIVLGGANLARFVTPAVKTGPLDYMWRLAEPTALTRFVVWTSYFAHQLFSWGTIWYARRQQVKYTKTLHPFNMVALLGNAAFIMWHWLETQWIYDAGAQDVSILTSQWSVIFMLVIILAMESQRRGLFFTKKTPFHKQFIPFLRRYHGYIFSWAIVYTFWYHPMVPTLGHLVGFYYMFMLLIQSSLFFTTLHLNKVWTFMLEFMVLPHGALVAWQQGNGVWPMFLFGFAALIIITQMHGLGLSTRAKWFIVAAFIAANLLVYGVIVNSWTTMLRDLTAIPLIEYGTAFALYALFMVVLGGVRLWQRLATKSVAREV